MARRPWDMGHEHKQGGKGIELDIDELYVRMRLLGMGHCTVCDTAAMDRRRVESVSSVGASRHDSSLQHSILYYIMNIQGSR